MTYLMMKISNWQRSATGEPRASSVCREFNLSAADIDGSYGRDGVVRLGVDEYTVMVTPDGAKAMLAKHVDNTVAGHGPYVSGPYSSPGIAGM